MKEEKVDGVKLILAYDKKLKRRVMFRVVNGYAISLITGYKFKYIPKKEKEIKVYHKSNSDDWETPIETYFELEKEFNFNFDPCPYKHDLDKWDGLEIEWKERNFINPPYSQVKHWIKKGYEESLKGKLCVFLVPARTDTRWFHEYVYNKAEIRFIKGRLKFSGHKNSAPFPSMIIIFKGGL